jgi:para-aminobenzoate synthetase component 1
MSAPFVLFDHGPIPGGTLFRDPVDVIRADTPDDLDGAFGAIERARADGHWVVGMAAYELGYCFDAKLRPYLPTDRAVPLMEFGVFRDAKPAGDFAQGSQDAHLVNITPDWDEARYARAFDVVQDYISAGDFYQANLTFALQAEMVGTAMDLYRSLRAAQPVPYGTYHDLGGPVILSRSPELFFRVREGVIQTHPMKGTIARDPDPARDRAARDWLQTDAKNRAENLMIVDLLRNDISRIAKVGSVKVPDLFAIETYSTVHQMVSRVRGDLVPDLTLRDMFAALFPCGSVTGAPKIRAMQVLAELESGARDAYCGALGWIAPGGDMEFNVGIRTLRLDRGGQVHFNVGGGVVHDSTAASEYQEALWKARFARLPQTA